MHDGVPHLLDTLLKRALDARASDIHFQPYLDNLAVRFRIDGTLFSEQPLVKTLGIKLTARIKVLAHLNVAERRLPQDGKFVYQTNEGHDCDIRVATFPSLYGEKVVLRLLDFVEAPLSVTQLGLSKKMQDSLSNYAAQECGFLLVTGPTGSGKTTTVHAFLTSLDSESHNIVTLEDPVEYTIRGVTQSQVQPEIGLTFEKGLRSLVRQDPDVIMVGEIRDRETAHVAIQAALTGHHVVSTLHTTDAPSALIRLAHMGCERFLIAAAIKVVIAQRLVRRLCTLCCRKSVPTHDQTLFLKKYALTVDYMYVAVGCATCRGTGYYGRIGIFQMMVLTPALRALFIENTDYDKLLTCSFHEGMQPLLFDATQKLAAGVISFAEYMRIAPAVRY